MTSIEKLKAIYDMEINIKIESFWDAGYYCCLGDGVGGYRECQSFENLEEGIDWLYERAKKTNENT